MKDLIKLISWFTAGVVIIVTLLILVCPMDRLTGEIHNVQLSSLCSSSDMSNSAACADIHFSKINYLLGILPESVRNIFVFLALVFSFFVFKRIDSLLVGAYKYVIVFFDHQLYFLTFIKALVESKIHNWFVTITGQDYAFLV